MKQITDNTLYFAKSSEDVILPSKNIEDGGYDIYAHFEGDEFIILPHETKMIPTGLYSAFSDDFVIILKERGSTGTKGMAQRCGVIDSGYRGEILVPITNTTNSAIIITKEDIGVLEKDTNKQVVYTDAFGSQQSCKIKYYPYSKAICQALLLPVPKVEVKEITIDELKSIPSKRGEGKLGSSNK